MSNEPLSTESLNDAPITDEQLRTVGINSETWERAKELGWEFATNVGLGEYSYAATLTSRGYDVLIGDPMGPEGPVEPSENSEGFLSSQGLYVLRSKSI